MIRLEPAPSRLSPSRRFGLEVLVDLSRLIPVSDPAAAAPRLTVVEEAADLAAVLRSPEGAFRLQGDEVVIPDGLLDHVVAVVAAMAEQRSTASDRHGRVPASANVLVSHGLQSEPVVSRVAIELRRAVAVAQREGRIPLLPPWPGKHRWAAAVTHDVDVVAGWPLFLALRLLELARKGEVAKGARALGAASLALMGDPVSAGIATVLGEEHNARVEATWFLLAGRPALRDWVQGDVTYPISGARGRRITGKIRDAGHAVGLHGSLRTSVEPARFSAERTLVESVAGAPPAGIRQHFLKLRPGATHAQMVNAGFEYDATMGFADRNGFRLGVADVVPAWVDGAGKLALDLVPLIWMDRVASKYQGIEAVDRWIDEALSLAARCRSVDGLWTGLWHPNLIAPLGYPGAPEGFVTLLDRLGADRPWFASMDRIVRWRRVRRGIVARTIEAGVPVFDGGHPLPPEVELDWEPIGR